MRANTQYQVMIGTLQKLDEVKEEQGQFQLHYDNDYVIAFDREFANFLDYKKKLLKTPWGKQLKQKVSALRATDSFQDLKLVWKEQCKSEAGKNLKSQFEKFMTISVAVFVLSDQPDGFADMASVRTFVEMVDMFDETLDGNPGEVLDWMFDDE